MLLSEAWFEAIAAALFAILVFATSYRPPWWFWSGSSHQPDTSSKDRIKSRYQTAQDVPGPFALPIIGTRWIFSCFGWYQMNKIHDAYKDLNRRYGPLCKEEALWNFPVISVFSRRDIEAVLRRASRYPLRPPQEIISQYRQSRQDRYTNLGLVNEQGETWQKLRAALTPKLMGANTVSGFVPALNQVSDDFINLIRVLRSGDDVTGFKELAYRMGLESTCTLILGRHLGFLKPHSATSLATRLAEAVRIHFTASRDAFYGLPFWKILPTTAYKQLIKSEDAIYNIISELLETTICEQEKNARDEGVEAVFQSILRDTNLDMRDKRAAIIDFIAAGIHTLGNTLVFLFYLIGSDAKAQKRLYEEVADLAPPSCDIAADDLRNAKYLRACITEAFRVIPTAPCIARILDEPIELSGYHLKAGVWMIKISKTVRNGYQRDGWKAPVRIRPFSSPPSVPVDEYVLANALSNRPCSSSSPRLYENSRSWRRKSSICNSNLSSHLRDRYPLHFAIVRTARKHSVELPKKNSFFCSDRNNVVSHEIVCP